MSGIVKLRLTAAFGAQYGGFATDWSPVSWGSLDELFVNLTMPMKRSDFATDQRVRSLGERLPYTLYKYMRVDDEQRLEWLRRLLVDGELYFASSAELNDPFECAIAPSFTASEDQILEYARDWVERQGGVGAWLGVTGQVPRPPRGGHATR